MKKFLILISSMTILMFGLIAIAEEQADVVGPLVHTNVSTGTYTSATDQVTSELYASGWADAVIVQFSGASTPDVDIDVVTSTNSFFQERTLLSLDNVTADGVYPIRDMAVTTAGGNATNEYTRIPLINEKIATRVYNSTQTNVNVRIWLVKTKN